MLLTSSVFPLLGEQLENEACFVRLVRQCTTTPRPRTTTKTRLSVVIFLCKFLVGFSEVYRPWTLPKTAYPPPILPTIRRYNHGGLRHHRAGWRRILLPPKRWQRLR